MSLTVAKLVSSRIIYIYGKFIRMTWINKVTFLYFVILQEKLTFGDIYVRNFRNKHFASRHFRTNPASIQSWVTISPPVKHHSECGPILHAYWEPIIVLNKTNI